ncbi:uncharacterized protein BXZ73DRAFT_88859 [Epithele typhae]|uniref:uncharacterized protein n=1 Tax=Epithele typhae TaxID=378194 RepID=UPI0020076EE7|nr:uncharacterized protein BXZ73DRAFT_88859 [Epithele typhae]KAH9939618.1 hypothetical protein BXZ73DRAFT_88859 [Epithele typhae]
MPSNDPFVAHQQAVVAACAQHEQAYRQNLDYRRCIPFVIHTTNYFVKFGDSWCFTSEAMMQKEFAIVAEGDPNAPRVPVVYHVFQHEHLTYAIIEFVETVQVSEDIFVHKVAAAILWLRRPAWHIIFKNKHAPLLFTGAMALERFLNKAVSMLQRREPGLAKISIAGEPLVLTQSDMDHSNFAVDATGRPIIFDFGQIGWLPESLANFTLLGTSSFAADVSVHVFGDGLDSVAASSNLASMCAVRVCLGMGSRANLGLDKDGNPAT